MGRRRRPTLGAPLTGHTDSVLDVAYSPDGHGLTSISSDGTVRTWLATATPQVLCDKLTTDMSHGHWREWISPDTNIPYVKLCPELPGPTD
jgi:WD40 repeat protein